LRFPRMARWRRDKKAEEADQVATLRNLQSQGRRAGPVAPLAR